MANDFGLFTCLPGLPGLPGKRSRTSRRSILSLRNEFKYSEMRVWRTLVAKALVRAAATKGLRRAGPAPAAARGSPISIK
ncbi:hypothetical protein EVAR_60945_1 [Eumeta japonica]|uniref:Uncharacterized protein n=1 Tax=Eumeta variegata TaxID=151549 RepID=A0A4C1XTP3_EUMVA|nr:hypothetical protein EVAR_60945_1 [Eumeta japonica]